MDFRDLAQFQRYNDGFQSDAEAMKLFRATGVMVAQGSVHDELLEQLTKPVA
jgi:hypothetical protein